MKWSIFLLVAAVFLVGGCSPGKHLAKTQQQQDSTRVEIRKEIVYVPDTVYLEIQAQTAERTTRDSTSHLENDYAESDARINSDGSLYHDLKTKPQEIPKEQTPVERNDSIVYKYKDRTVYETVERELSLMERIKLAAFWYLAGAVALCVCLLFRKPLWAALRKII